MQRVLVIDNYDSFTYNLVQQIESLGGLTIVHEHDRISIVDIEELSPDKIVISPGPGTPSDAGVSSEVIRHFAGSIPLLGVCLGHQCIAEVFGGSIGSAIEIKHGKTSRIFLSPSTLFRGLPRDCTVARYHSLAVKEVPPGFTVSAHTGDGEVMAIEDDKRRLYGIQFHPESFMTIEGPKIMKNFLDL